MARKVLAATAICYLGVTGLAFVGLAILSVISDPQASRETIGCIAFLPLFVVAVAVGAYAGFRAGELLTPAAGVQDLADRLAFLGGADGLGFAVLLYWRAMGGPRAASALAPLSVFLMFMVVGMNRGHGFGVTWLLVWGIANGCFGFIVVLLLLSKKEPPTPDAR